MKKVIFMFVAAAALTFAACTDEKKADTPAPEGTQTETPAPEVKEGDAPAADANANAPEAKKDDAPEAKKDDAAATDQKAGDEKKDEKKDEQPK